MNNLIGDMLVRIKNASLARRQNIEAPYTSLGEKLAGLLVKSGYLEKVSIERKGLKRDLKIDLKYDGKKTAISDLRQISKPGLRRYLKIKDLSKLRRSGRRLLILSTSKGLMSLDEAKKKNIGGELLCEVW